MKIISYNVNGIRAALNKGFDKWLAEASPDVLCIQETKAQPEQIDTNTFKNLGYETFIFSAKKKGYSGVAILAKKVPTKVIAGIDNEFFDNEGRFLRVDYGDISVVSTYFPSGSNPQRQAVKMQWLDIFTNYIKKLKKERPKLIISGDFNICRLWIDIHNPEKQLKTSGFLPEERKWFADFLDIGFVDSFRQINNTPHKYSWWSYRAAARQRNKGWRIDYNLVSQNLQNNITDAYILKDVKHSDHCPVGIELSE